MPREVPPWAPAGDAETDAEAAAVLEAMRAQFAARPVWSVSALTEAVVRARGAEHAVLLRDTKWPAASTDVRELYCLLIVKRAHAHLRSVRDLRGPDAPWLAATVRACEAHIQQRFGVAPARVRAFFHYPPSFYHLHVHFVHVDSPANGPSTYAGRALLVADVLQNLRLDPDYYRHATLTICAAEKTLAVSALINAGAVSHPLGAGAGDDDEVQKN